jgi:hypothetical protein
VHDRFRELTSSLRSAGIAALVSVPCNARNAKPPATQAGAPRGIDAVPSGANSGGLVDRRNRGSFGVLTSRARVYASLDLRLVCNPPESLGVCGMSKC